MATTLFAVLVVAAVAMHVATAAVSRQNPVRTALVLLADFDSMPPLQCLPTESASQQRYRFG